MKKFYSILIIAFIGYIGNAQIINIPDADFKQRLLLADATNWRYAKDLNGNFFRIDANEDSEIQVSEALQVSYLDISSTTYITDLTGINFFANLRELDCGGNALTSLDVSSLTNLRKLSCDSNHLTALDVSGLNNLEFLKCSQNQISNLNLTGIVTLQYLNCQGNLLPTLNLSRLNGLIGLYCDNNMLTTLDIGNLTNLTLLTCASNQLSTLNVASNNNIEILGCSYNQLTTLDVSNLTHLVTLYCDNNRLTSLFIKNGSNEVQLAFAYHNEGLQYVCADDFQLGNVLQQISQSTLTNCQANSYCSFTPGGTFYTINGNSRYDFNNNGCDTGDTNYPKLKLSFSNGSITGSLISDSSGNYSIPVLAGTHTITPVLENPDYFNFSPATATVAFPATASPFTQNFCFSPNGTHNDLEIAIFPLTPARPGFDAQYKIIYKNKGNQIQNGIVSFDYYDPIEDLVAAIPNFTSESTNFMHTLNWNFSNLNPFESREILVTFNLNSPIETPALNAGNLITYSARITNTTDETPADNTSNLNQTVVNSFDPNDKTCIEGSNLPINEIGKYLHYIIRFENTGTANAENIVVKDMIDITKLDINTLVPLSGSHSFETKISSTNKVEFIFQNINLPFDDANNDGYVAFKIKTLPSLAVENVINNSANIYFDYNAPIVTNTSVVNVFNPLATPDFEFGSVFRLSPVPAKNNLIITTKQEVIMSSVSIYNTIGQLVQVSTNPTETIDVSGLKAGNYFIKIISDKGTATSKFVKE